LEIWTVGVDTTRFMLSGSPITTAWRVLDFGWSRRPPDMDGSSEYIE